MKWPKPKRGTCPPQITIGGQLGRKIWRTMVLPLLQSEVSTRNLGIILGVSHNTIAKWKRYYL